MVGPKKKEATVIHTIGQQMKSGRNSIKTVIQEPLEIVGSPGTAGIMLSPDTKIDSIT